MDVSTFRGGLVAGAVLLALGGAAPAVAAPPRPPTGSVSVSTQFADCSLAESGRFAGSFVARYVNRVTVEWIGASERPGSFYLKTDARLDHEIGTGRWRALEKRAGETAKFANAPFHTTPGVRSVVGPTIATQERMRGKLTVTLMKRRTGPDKKVWRFTWLTPIVCNNDILRGSPGN